MVRGKKQKSVQSKVVVKAPDEGDDNGGETLTSTKKSK